jgi:hypothetical protein
MEGKSYIMNVSKTTYREMIIARLEELRRLALDINDPEKTYEEANEVLFQTLLNITDYIGNNEISETLEEIASTYIQIVEQSDSFLIRNTIKCVATDTAT